MFTSETLDPQSDRIRKSPPSERVHVLGPGGSAALTCALGPTVIPHEQRPAAAPGTNGADQQLIQRYALKKGSE